jgi:DHA2 family multidrug resistance protein
MIVLAISFLMRANLNAQTDYMSVAIAMLVLGAGVPACLVTLTSLAVSDLPADKVASGSGLQNFIRIMSMAVGASLISTYWEHATKDSRANLVAIIDPTIEESPGAIYHGIVVRTDSAPALAGDGLVCTHFFSFPAGAVDPK